MQRNKAAGVKSDFSGAVDADWRGMFKVGSITFVFLGVLFAIALVGVALLGTIPTSTIGGELSYISSHATYYELSYGSELIAGFLLFPSVFSAFLALRYTSRAWATVGFGTMVVGIPIFILTAVEALGSFTLANSYSTALSQTQSSVILGAGLATITSASFLSKATYVVFAVGSTINGVLFAKSEHFGKLLAGLVIAASCFSVVGLVFTAALAPAIILFVAAFIVTGVKLNTIAKRSVPL